MTRTTAAIRMHLAQALTRCDDPDAIEHIAAARELVAELPPAEFAECEGCGVQGLPEQIAAHECEPRRVTLR